MNRSVLNDMFMNESNYPTPKNMNKVGFEIPGRSSVQK